MSEFLEQWDWAIRDAVKNGLPGRLVRVNSDQPYDWTLVARTMHPAFMQPKGDEPRRDT